MHLERRPVSGVRAMPTSGKVESKLALPHAGKC
jgi:hypothetical protein